MKEFIKDYILSQIQQTTPSNEIQILNQSEQTSEKFGYSYVQCGEYIVFYENSTTSAGMNFYIYDKALNLIKSEHLTDNWITIVGQTLQQDENGNFYLLGYMNPDETPQGALYYSLILLNNIITETPTIRKWYKMNTIGLQEGSLCRKKEGSSSYMFIYEQTRTESGTIYKDLYLKEYTINVSSGNTYKTWVYRGYTTGITSYLLPAGYLYNQETTQMLVLSQKSNGISVNLINLDDGDWQENVTNEISVGTAVKIHKTISDSIAVLQENQSIIINSISSFAYINQNTKNLVQYNVLDNFTTPRTRNVTEGSVVTFLLNQDYVGYITGTESNYIVDLFRYELTEDDIVISTNYIRFNVNFEYDITEYALNLNLISTQVYNLSYIAFVIVEIAGNGISTIIATDNSVAEYQDFNSLVPSYVNIANGSILFSRKLTNKSIIGNQMSAEVNVPYSMLNQNFSIEQLVSQTYKVLANENKAITKNIYESLYLNFIKHINVIDNNFGKNELQNDISTLLTQSVFGTPQENYEKAPIGYAKVFTTDGQELIFSIGQNAIEQIGDYEYQISIAVNGNNADKLQILAKDKKTPYVTIPLHSVDRVILLKQNFRIEEG